MANEKWFETSAGLYLVRDDTVLFYDDWDHWNNGFCRLLEITDAKARDLVERYAQKMISPAASLSAKVDALRSAVRQVLANADSKSLNADLVNADLSNSDLSNTDLSNTDSSNADQAKISTSGMAFDGSRADYVFASSISGNLEKQVVGNKALQYAWLLDEKTKTAVRADSVNYDETYFQDPQHPHLGMRNYTSDQDWRLEKSRRQLRIIQQNYSASEKIKTALDIGSGAGYFRKALAEANIQHYGLEQSTDAIKICKDKFGYDCIQGEIADMAALAPHHLGKIDLITLWDVIEHLDDGLSTLNILKQFLTETGIIVIRTPNLVSLEYEILGDFYYSFKLDHIKYYSPLSLNKLASLAGLRKIYLETTSHIFKGFFGMDALHQCTLNDTGADIIVMYGR